MADFIRKNMMLVIFLGITAVAAAVLVIMDLERYYKIGLSIEKIEADGDKITRINNTGRKAPGEFKENPEWTDEEREAAFEKWNKNRLDTRIVGGNATRILQDAADLEKKTWETQRVYGHAYDIAFNQFLQDAKNASAGSAVKEAFAELDIPAVQKMLESCVKGKNFARFSPEEQGRLFLELRNEICKAPCALKSDAEKNAFEKEAGTIFDNAFAGFAKSVQTTTSEDFSNITLGNPAQSLFLQVLGIPRFFNDSALYSAYVDKLASTLVDKQAFPMEDVKLLDWQVRNILAGLQRNNQEVQPPPHQDNIPYYMTRIQIYEDLFARMKKAGISDLITLLPEGETMGKREGSDYRIYSYKVAVNGSLPKIRKFMNSLHQAYKENRVYRISNFVLERKDSMTADNQGGVATVRSMEIVTSMRVIEKYIDIVDKREKLEAAKAAGKETSLANDKFLVKNEEDDPDYGAVSLGAHDQIVARFDLDYVVYAGDMIGKTKTK